MKGHRNSIINSATKRTSFPLTTNQELHNKEQFAKAAISSGNQQISTYNCKKVSPFSSFVNASFNMGVYSKPTHD